MLWFPFCKFADTLIRNVSSLCWSNCNPGGIMFPSKAVCCSNLAEYNRHLWEKPFIFIQISGTTSTETSTAADHQTDVGVCRCRKGEGGAVFTAQPLLQLPLHHWSWQGRMAHAKSHIQNRSWLWRSSLWNGWMGDLMLSKLQKLIAVFVVVVVVVLLQCQP